MYEEKHLADFMNTFDPSKRSQILKVYYESLINYIEQGCQAADVGDYERLRSISHDIKGLAYMINAPELGDVAENIELNAMEGRANEAVAKVPDMKKMTGEVLVVLEDYKSHLA